MNKKIALIVTGCFSLSNFSFTMPAYQGKSEPVQFVKQLDDHHCASSPQSITDMAQYFLSIDTKLCRSPYLTPPTTPHNDGESKRCKTPTLTPPTTPNKTSLGSSESFSTMTKTVGFLCLKIPSKKSGLMKLCPSPLLTPPAKQQSTTVYDTRFIHFISGEQLYSSQDNLFGSTDGDIETQSVGSHSVGLCIDEESEEFEEKNK